MVKAAHDGAAQVRNANETKSSLNTFASLSVPGLPSLPGIGEAVVGLKSLAYGSLPSSVVGKVAVAPKLATSVDCASLSALANLPGMPSFSCSGTIAVDTNISGTSNGSVPGGSYIDMSYRSFTINVSGFGHVAINGGLRINYLTDFVTAPSANGVVQYVANAITVTGPDGKTTAPQTGTLKLTYTQGAVALEENGVRVSDISATVTNDANYLINRATLLAPSAAGYFNYSYSNWSVINGRPAVGSSATITALQGQSASLTVLSSSATQVQYRVNFLLNGVTTSYVVTTTMDSAGAITSLVATAA